MKYIGLLVVVLLVGCNPVAPTPNALGGYRTAPPSYDDTGRPQPGWTQGTDGLWRFVDPAGSR